MDCRDRIALVTGASGGIGGAVAVALAQGGAKVAVAYHQNVTRAGAVVEEIASIGGEALLVQADLTDPDAASDLIATVERSFGRLDVLVNNAGTSLEKLLIDTTLAEWDHVMNLHLRAAYICCKRALPGMIQRRYGRIVNITSMWGQVGAACEVAYSAAKAGLIGLTKALAKEVGGAGITINAVAPGVIVTDMLAGYDDEALDQLVRETPVARLGVPSDVARVVRFLAADATDFITGQVVAANGGFVV